MQQGVILKILLVGSWVSETYEEPLYNALKSLNQKVIPFKWGPFFGFKPLSNKYDNTKNKLYSIWYRVQNKFIFGPSIIKLNFNLLKISIQTKPDVIFLYRATHVWPSTVRKLKKLGPKIFVYNNDDPFTQLLPKYTYRHFFKSLKYADWIFSYRNKNIREYETIGFKNTSLLRSSFIKDINFFDSEIKKVYDIIFIGHFENDGRDRIVLDLLKNPQIRFGIWGLNWNKSRLYDEICSLWGKEITPLFGKDYNRTLNSSLAALVFFSKINNDQYTRRCFEIPATKTTMISERTEEMETLYKEGKEVLFFDSIEDLSNKINEFLKNKETIKAIGENGYRRLILDKHEIKNRAQSILDKYLELSQQ